jgi:hypothetical protein
MKIDHIIFYTIVGVFVLFCFYTISVTTPSNECIDGKIHQKYWDEDFKRPTEKSCVK